ncbi:hypothetical protein GALMADRAFT_1272141 [Galerina marginata CBS 339.88]|uniref:Uncharacterized protein n=1 Tax=Galerina marginata (strain CBS 339.88) TaxID=685588 RepID=A0A067TIM2_GALM3|nr:hypothetical protein GALMADRAFT_1272141 [Galerina marginata CBS 339.88]
MFKRVEKRRRKKEEEQELGLDDDMKEVLGIHDTDSEESASESDSDGSSGDEGEELEMGKGHEIDGEEDAENTDELGDEAEDEDEDPNIRVSQALNDPIYVVSVLPEVKACIVCPGKLLKGVKMEQLHRISNAHERRFEQLKTLSVGCEPNESAWEVLKLHAEEMPKLPMTVTVSTSNSRRAEKKKAQQERRKLKRQKFKARQAAKKTAATSAPIDQATPEEGSKALVDPSTDTVDRSKTTSPPKKKRKVADHDKPTIVESVVAETSPKRLKPRKKQGVTNSISAPSTNTTHTAPRKTQESVKNIVRSTSDRAKNARSRALSMSKTTTSSSKDNKSPRKKAINVGVS